jgi:hypothetical protein
MEVILRMCLLYWEKGTYQQRFKIEEVVKKLKKTVLCNRRVVCFKRSSFIEENALNGQ